MDLLKQQWVFNVLSVKIIDTTNLLPYDDLWKEKIQLNSLFSTLSCEKTRVFFVSHNSTEVH